MNMENEGKKTRREPKTDPESAQVNWNGLEENEVNRALLLAAEELGAQAEDFVGLLKLYGESLTESQRQNLKKTNFKNRAMFKYSSQKNMLAALRNLYPSPSKTIRAEMFVRAREYLREHRPEELWPRDRLYSSVVIYLLGEGRATLNQVHSALRRAMKAEKLSSTTIYNKVRPKIDELQKNYPDKPRDEVEREAFFALAKDIAGSFTPPLDEDELRAGEEAGRLALEQVLAEAYTGKQSWKRNSSARALTAEMLDLGASVPSVVSMLKHYYNVETHRDSVGNTTSSRLRLGCSRAEIAGAKSLAQEAIDIFRSASQLREGPEREARLDELWKRVKNPQE